MADALNIPKERAQAAYDEFMSDYPNIEISRQKTKDSFCSMRQPGGEGTAVIWNDPAEYVETFLGFRRFFPLENQITKIIFDLAHNPPAGWRSKIDPVIRRNRVQTVQGATASALYATAFSLQAANMRAAANHEIQSPGAQITKRLQRRIYDRQPSGVHPLLVAPLNIHDELMVVSAPSVVDDVVKIVRDTVEFFRPQVPLIAMTWFKRLASWAGKKGDEKNDPDKVSIAPPGMAA
jgi:DNA polymerase I-like protein with 3'-5' exonuclease and polymerase domains